MPQLPFNQPADFLKERDFGQKIEATFDFLRAHFRPFMRCLVYIVLPAALVNSIVTGLFQRRLPHYLQRLVTSQIRVYSGGPRFSRTIGGPFAIAKQYGFGIFEWPLYLFVILLTLITFALFVLTVYGYVVLRQNSDDPAAQITVAQVWALVRRRLPGTIAAFLGLGLLFYGSMFLMDEELLGFAIPFLHLFLLYAGIALSLFFIIWVREELGFFDTIRRCFYLISGKWWSTFWLLVVMTMIVGLISLITILPITLLGAWQFVIPNHGPISTLVTVALTSLDAISKIFLYPLIFLAIAFQYFNLVERKDGEGLRALINRIGQPTPTTTTHPEDRYKPDEEGDY